MTRYTVVWLQRALDELATMWSENIDYRNEITNASKRIDDVLAVDPEIKVQPVTELLSIAVFAPLVVSVHIKPLDRIVEVGSVKLLRRENGRAAPQNP